MLSFPLWPLGQLVLLNIITFSYYYLYIITFSYSPKQDGCAEIAHGKSCWPVVILRLSGGVQVDQGQPPLWTSNNNLHGPTAERVFIPWLHAQKQHGDTFSPLISEWSQGDWHCYLAGHSGAQGQWDLYRSRCSQKYLLEEVLHIIQMIMVITLITIWKNCLPTEVTSHLGWSKLFYNQF